MRLRDLCTIKRDASAMREASRLQLGEPALIHALLIKESLLGLRMLLEDMPLIACMLTLALRPRGPGDICKQGAILQQSSSRHECLNFKPFITLEAA